MEVFIPALAKVEIQRVRDMILAYKEGRIDEEIFRRFRLENGIYGIRFQKDIQLIRVKIPGGILNSLQLKKLGEVAKLFSTRNGHVTTRQDIEFPWVPLESVPEVLSHIAEVGLNSREACGNTVRNVTLCPLAGVSDEEAFDVTPYARAVANYFVRNPLSQNLPRKVKISFEGCSTTDHVATAIHDIGAWAAVKVVNGKIARGFRIYVGGGLSTMPTEAAPLEEFTPVEQLLPTFEAIIRVFDRLGNRDNAARARIKFLIQKVSFDKFRQLVIKERDIAWSTRAGDRLWDFPEVDTDADEDKECKDISPNDSVEATNIMTARTSDQGFDAWVRTNVHRQKQLGYYYLYVTLPAGDVTSDQFVSLADIARKFSRGKLRTTRTQNLVLRWLREDALYQLYKELKSVGLGEPGVNRLVNVVGCPGADTCNLAITHSHRLALELFKQFSKRQDLVLADDLKDITIHVSGCPNSCGQHHIAPIGFYGSASRVNGRQAPYYTMLLGGEISFGSATFGQVVAKVPAKRVPEAVIKLIDTYRTRRTNGETFMQWVRRLQKEEQEGETRSSASELPGNESVVIAGENSI